MNFKFPRSISVFDPQVDAQAPKIIKLCFGHGIPDIALLRETLKCLENYLSENLEKLYPLSFVIAVAAARAHYSLMIEIHGRSGNREQLPWTEINQVHDILVNYLFENEPKFAPDTEYEDGQEVKMKIRLWMNDFTSNNHSNCVGPNVWAMLKDAIKQAN